MCFFMMFDAHMTTNQSNIGVQLRKVTESHQHYLNPPTKFGILK